MTQSPLPPDPASPVSGSTLAYLFADRFALSAAPYTPGEVVVSTELSGGLVAIALWQLCERGAVALEPYSGKKLGFIPDSGVHIRFLNTVAAGGLEKKMLDHLQGSKRAAGGRESARDMGNRMAMGGKDPRGAVISLAVDEAVAAGCLSRGNGQGGLAGKLAGKAVALEAHADRIAVLASAADQLAARWRSFGEGEQAELATMLRSTALSGVAARVRNVQYS